MKRIGAMLSLSALLCAATGCGTMANLDGRETLIGWPERPPLPFGGVANDMTWMTRGTLSPPAEYDKSFAFLLGLSDLPLSLVGDVVTLPWTTFEFTREKLLPTGRYEKSSIDRDRDRGAERKRQDNVNEED